MQPLGRPGFTYPTILLVLQTPFSHLDPLRCLVLFCQNGQYMLASVVRPWI
jgi:hypothetical protein